MAEYLQGDSISSHKSKMSVYVTLKKMRFLRAQLLEREEVCLYFFQ